MVNAVVWGATLEDVDCRSEHCIRDPMVAWRREVTLWSRTGLSCRYSKVEWSRVGYSIALGFDPVSFLQSNSGPLTQDPLAKPFQS